MKISFYKPDMTSALGIVSRAVATKSNTPILSGLYLATVAGAVEITATNLGVATSGSVPCAIEREGAVVVPGKLFTEIIKKMPDETVTIETSEGVLQVKSGATQFTLPTFKAEDFPKAKKPEGTKLEINPQLMKDIISKTITAAERKDETRPIFTGVLLELKDGVIKATATNTHRLHHFVATHDFKGEITTIIPASALEDLHLAIIRSEDKAPIKIYFNERSVSFMVDKFLSTARIIDGQYPPYEKVLDLVPAFSITVDSRELKAALARVELISKISEYKAVTFEISEGELKLIASSEVTTAVELLEIEGGTDFAISFNLQYVLDVVNAANSPFMEITFSKDRMNFEKPDPYAPAHFKGKGDLHFRGIVTPVRTR